MGYGLVNWYFFHLYTPPRITSNYSALANLHTLQITTAPATHFPACCVLTSFSLATAYNSGKSSASRAQVIVSRPSVQKSCQLSTQLQRLLYSSSTELVAPVLFHITTLHGPHRKHSSSVVTCVFISAGTCLPSRCS
jgi:CBS domain containing-hemolysin-like protein